MILDDVRTLITAFMTDDQTRHPRQLVGASPKINVGRKIVIPFNYWLELAAKVIPIKCFGGLFFITQKLNLGWFGLVWAITLLIF